MPKTRNRTQTVQHSNIDLEFKCQHMVWVKLRNISCRTTTKVTKSIEQNFSGSPTFMFYFVCLKVKMTECQFREPAYDWRLHRKTHKLPADKTGHFICPSRSKEVNIEPFFLKHPFLLNHSGVFFCGGGFHLTSTSNCRVVHKNLSF